MMRCGATRSTKPFWMSVACNGQFIFHLHFQLAILTSYTSTLHSSTKKPSNRPWMITSPSPRTSTTALTHAARPWKIARKAYCGKKANTKRIKYTISEITDSGNRRLRKRGQNSFVRTKCPIPRNGYEAARAARRKYDGALGIDSLTGIVAKLESGGE